VVPSFVVLDVQTDLIVAYLYRLINDEVKVERVQFKKSTNRQAINANEN
jgi:vacuolar protein sorting-associated protein 29